MGDAGIKALLRRVNKTSLNTHLRKSGTALQTISAWCTGAIALSLGQGDTGDKHDEQGARVHADGGVCERVDNDVLGNMNQVAKKAAMISTKASLQMKGDVD